MSNKESNKIHWGDKPGGDQRLDVEVDIRLYDITAVESKSGKVRSICSVEWSRWYWISPYGSIGKMTELLI